MSKVLMVDYGKCTGCLTCEMACSVKHEGLINNFQSRIKIIKGGNAGKGIPMTCVHCESAPCMAVCPVRAISRDEELNRVMIDDVVCIGCRMCVAVCPFGNVNFDSISRKIIKCDLCDGDPSCVKFCGYDALKYIDVSEESTEKRTAIADKVTDITRRVAAAMSSE